ncbi:uncharacterized protein H6S33_007110 [Morchella sextelata]|uniref:uncharacterized protein n=1 Tax=Morchella sextelata TaxID=1174677 RepID=UPI001D042189|nr:uncharacterized protein H6S33_007110 [Morchella sextelata]KAH0604079.1 hypothetical protein H6S33_007110 [Morchella sextelata]
MAGLYLLCPSDERSPVRNGREWDILFTNGPKSFVAGIIEPQTGILRLIEIDKGNVFRSFSFRVFMVFGSEEIPLGVPNESHQQDLQKYFVSSAALDFQQSCYSLCR